MDNRKVPKRAIAYQYGIAMIASMGAMTSGAWLAWPSAAIKPLLKGEKCCTVSRGQVSTMVALMDLGNILTPIPSSYFMDWIGRKLTLYITSVMYIISSISVIAANDVWYLYVARFFAGLAKGVAFAVVPIYLAEVANVQIRGALSTMFIGFLNIGMFYDYFFGALLSYEALNIANVVIPIIFSIGFLFVPESPYYLTMKKKENKAIKSLSKYRQLKRDNEALLAEAKMVSATVEKDLEQKGRFIDIFTTKEMRRATLIIVLLALFQRSSGISPTLAYSTITLPETGGGISREMYMVIFSFILIVANYIATPLIDTWGRKKLLIYSALSSAITQMTAGLFYFFESRKYDVSSWNWLPYCCVIIFALTYSLGIGFIPSTLVGELFPTNVKCYASSVSAIILAATSFVVNRVFREVADNFGVEYMYFFFSLTSVACVIFTILYVFETKGKTFVEIQNILKESTEKVPVI
ncbi:facilitated trehalose transporter Tret1 isoform X2 [Halyomorpha halys]|uniref:facilitated trehalose transporter Tret1 isoform X2 n=1 Tax=Halyomorpha halys TaxID=286706 RepID=UPI0006D4CA70|nr:facilitated trehalose transporter Tret1-like isoform X2 [Halyomorpha halys]